jgi:hypothetical protein
VAAGADRRSAAAVPSAGRDAAGLFGQVNFDETKRGLPDLL